MADEKDALGSLAALRADLALAEQIPLSELDDVAEFTLDMHLAFGRLTDALPHLLDVAEAATEARNALAEIVVMLGNDSGDPMGTALQHFEWLDELLASRASHGQARPA